MEVNATKCCWNDTPFLIQFVGNTQYDSGIFNYRSRWTRKCDFLCAPIHFTFDLYFNNAGVQYSTAGLLCGAVWWCGMVWCGGGSDVYAKITHKMVLGVKYNGISNSHKAKKLNTVCLIPTQCQSFRIRCEQNNKGSFKWQNDKYSTLFITQCCLKNCVNEMNFTLTDWQILWIIDDDKSK